MYECEYVYLCVVCVRLTLHWCTSQIESQSQKQLDSRYDRVCFYASILCHRGPVDPSCRANIVPSNPPSPPLKLLARPCSVFLLRKIFVSGSCQISRETCSFPFVSFIRSTFHHRCFHPLHLSHRSEPLSVLVTPCSPSLSFSLSLSLSAQIYNILLDFVDFSFLFFLLKN